MKDFMTDDEMDAAGGPPAPPDFISDDDMDQRSGRAPAAAPATPPEPTWEDDLDRLAKTHGVDKEWLRTQAQWQGYHPQEESDAQLDRGEHGAHLAGAARASLGSVLGEGVLGGLPSWIRKKLGTDQEEKALDDLRHAVDARKGMPTLIAEGVVGGGPVMAASKALKLGKLGTAALNVGDTAARTMMESDAGDEGEAALKGGGIAAGAELATNVVLPALGRGIKKALPAIGGVKKENIDHYLARPAEVRGAKQIEDIKDLADASIDKMKTTQQGARAALTVKEQAQRDLAQQLLDAAKDQTSQREAAAAQAWLAKQDELKNVRPPEALRQEIMGDLSALRRDISEQSAKSFDALSGETFDVPVSRLKGYLTMKLNELKIAGARPIGAAGDAFGKLEGYRQFLDDIDGNAIAATDAKKLIQMIDADTEALYAATAGKYTPPASRALRDFRGHIDETLKENPFYSRAMDGLGDDVKLLKRMVDDGFGDEESIAQLLRAVSGPKGEFTLRTLDEFGKRTGKDYVGQIQRYIDAQATRGSKVAMDNLQRSLPEYQRAERARAALAQLRPRAGEAAQLLLPSSAETKAVSNADKALESVAGWSPATTENRLKSVMSGKSIENRRAIEALEKQTGLPFSEMLADRRVADAFEKGYMHGSSNVNLWSAIGALFGGTALTGGKESPIGKLFGLGFGRAIDSAGPKLTQKVLDAFLALKGSKFAPVLEKAIERGPDALTAAHVVLMKNYPEYRQALGLGEEGAKP